MRGGCFMGEFSIFHWLVVLAIVLILFGGRKIPEVMKGLGEGIRNFKEGMSGASHTPTAPPPAPPAADKPAEEKKA
jgi:sec-independent protein translocase protein TatA